MSLNLKPSSIESFVSKAQEFAQSKVEEIVTNTGINKKIQEAALPELKNFVTDGEFNQKLTTALEIVSQKSSVLTGGEEEFLKAWSDEFCPILQDAITERIKKVKEHLEQQKTSKKISSKAKPGKFIRSIQEHTGEFQKLMLTSLSPSEESNEDEPANEEIHEILIDENNWPSKDFFQAQYTMSESDKEELYESFRSTAEIHPEAAPTEGAEMEKKLLNCLQNNISPDPAEIAIWEKATEQRMQAGKKLQHFHPTKNQQNISYGTSMSQAPSVVRSQCVEHMSDTMKQELVDIVEMKKYVGIASEGGRTVRLKVKEDQQQFEEGEIVTQVNIQGLGYSNNNEEKPSFDLPNTNARRQTSGYKIISHNNTPQLVHTILDSKSFGGCGLDEAIAKYNNQETLKKRLQEKGETASDIIPLAGAVFETNTSFEGEPQAVYTYFDKGEHRLRPFWNNLIHYIQFKDDPKSIKNVPKFQAEQFESNFPFELNSLEKCAMHLKETYQKAGENIRKIHEAGMAGLDLQPGNIGGGMCDKDDRFLGQGVIYDLGGLIDQNDAKNETIYFNQMLADVGTFLRGITWEFYQRCLGWGASVDDVQNTVFNTYGLNYFEDAITGYAGDTLDSKTLESIAKKCVDISRKMIEEDIELKKTTQLPTHASGSFARKVVAIKQAQKYGLSDSIPAYELPKYQEIIKNQLLMEFSLMETLPEMMKLAFPAVKKIAEKCDVKNIPTTEEIEQFAANFQESYAYQNAILLKQKLDLLAEGIKFRD